MTQINQHTEKKKQVSRKTADVLLACGLLLLLMETWKQLDLYLFYFKGHYNVWYVSFQLCSLPIYLCPLYAWICRKAPNGCESRLAVMTATFLQDYGMLGGIAALLVHDGFTYPGHPFLTLHGYLWHILLICISLYIRKNRLSDLTHRGFLSTLPLFFFSACIAETINVLLHPFGDCDMFYISPYHLSSQPVFHQIDAVIGRPLGILFYLGCVVLGAYLIHLMIRRIGKRTAF